MQKAGFKIIFKGLHFIAPFFYIAVGCVFLTDLFYEISEWKRVLFGIIIILYGLFRIYNAYAKIRDMK